MATPTSTLADIKLYTLFKGYATFVPERADFALEQGAFLHLIAEERLLDSGGIAFDEAVLLFNLHAVGRLTPCLTFKRFARVLQLVQARHPAQGSQTNEARRNAWSPNLGTFPARPSTAHPTRRTPEPLPNPLLNPPLPTITTHNPNGSAEPRPATANYPLSGSVTERYKGQVGGLESVPDGWRTIRDLKGRKRVGGPGVCRPEDMPVLLSTQLPTPEEAPPQVQNMLERCGRLCAVGGRYGDARKALRKAKQLWADHVSALEAQLHEKPVESDDSDSEKDEQPAKERGGKFGGQPQFAGRKSESRTRKELELADADDSDEAAAARRLRDFDEALKAAAKVRAERVAAATCVSMWACHVALCEGELISAEAALLLAVESEEEGSGQKVDAARESEGPDTRSDIRLTAVSFARGKGSQAETFQNAVRVESGDIAQPIMPADSQTVEPNEPQQSESLPPPSDPNPANGAGPESSTQAFLTPAKPEREPKRFPKSPVLLELMGTLSFHKMEYRDARECFERAGGSPCEQLLADLGCGPGGEPASSAWTSSGGQAAPVKKHPGKGILDKSATKKTLGRSPSKKPVKKEKKVDKGPGAYSFRTFGLATPRNEQSHSEQAGGVESVRRGPSPGLSKPKGAGPSLGGVSREIAVLSNIGACYHVLRERKKALSCYQKALALLADSNDAPSRAIVLRNKARALHVYSGLKPQWFHPSSSLESPPPSPHAAGQPNYGLDSVRAAAAGALGKGVVKTLGLRGPLRDQIGVDVKPGKVFDWTKVPPDEKDKKKRGAKGSSKGKT